jgi:hypothetical protein
MDIAETSLGDYRHIGLIRNLLVGIETRHAENTDRSRDDLAGRGARVVSIPGSLAQNRDQ